MWLVDSLVIPASLHDVEGHFVHVNEAAERASEKTNAQWLGRHFTEPLPPEVRENVAAQFRRAAERGEPTDFETVFVDASGNLRGVRLQPPSPLRRCDRRRSHSRVRSPPTAVGRDRPSASTATDASPTRGSRPDRLRPIDSGDRGATDHLARDSPQPSAESLLRAPRAHSARGDRGGSASRAPRSAGAGSSAAGPECPLATERPASASTPVGGRSTRVAPARLRTLALRTECP